MAKVRVFQDSKERARVGPRACPWSVEWRENGRRRSKTLGTKADAERFATLKQAELVDRATGVTTTKLWSEFLDEYERLVVVNYRSHETQRLAREALQRFTTIVNPKLVHAIDRRDLDEFVAKRLKMPGKKTGDTLSPETIKKELRHIRAALNVAHEWNYLRTVPKMPRVAGHQTEKRFMTEEHFDAIMTACEVARKPDPRTHHDVNPVEWWRVLLTMMWLTGIRVGALLALRWEDVDLERGVVWSRARANKSKRDLRHHVGRAVELLWDIAIADPRVFPWNHHHRTLWAEFARIQKTAGIHLPCLLKAGNPKHECTDACHVYAFHDIRRAHATYNYGKVTDRALQQQMGHASFQTTQQYIRYAELHQADVYPAHVPASIRDRQKGVRNDGKTAGGTAGKDDSDGGES
jgi:integrase